MAFMVQRRLRRQKGPGGWWQVDPTDRSVLIFLSHNMVELDQLQRGIGLEIWSAIARFHAIATGT